MTITLISNEGNLLISFVIKRYIAEWNKIIIKKIKKVKKDRVKNGIENLQLFIYAFSEQRFYITRRPNLSWCLSLLFFNFNFSFFNNETCFIESVTIIEIVIFCFRSYVFLYINNLKTSWEICYFCQLNFINLSQTGK